jgi:predicted  nucleic acid-binding Zn-ribbon protein
MAFPIRQCVACGEEFELKPGKPGFANRCPDCSEPGAQSDSGKERLSADERRAKTEADAERRKAIRDLLYRKDS